MDVPPSSPSPTTPGPAVDAAALVPVLQRLVDVVHQLIAALQATAGASAIAAPSAPAAPATPANGAFAAPGATGATTQARRGATAEFNVGTFNVLGASHTRPGSTHPGFRGATARIDGAIDTLRRSDVDVAGLQEFQGSQQADFRRKATEYETYAKGDNAITWKREAFRLVSKRSIMVPYFGGKEKDMPIVQLEDRATGKRAWFINVHNPTSNKRHPGNDGHRAEALRRERAMVEQLRATGLPVFLVGDFNDRAPARAAMTQGGLATASAPRGDERIDWIFGSGARFLDHDVDLSTRSRGVSDHPLVVARTQI